MQIDLTARQKAALVQELIHESSTAEMEVLTCKFIREYAKFQGADLSKIQKLVDVLTKSPVSSSGSNEDEF